MNIAIPLIVCSSDHVELPFYTPYGDKKCPSYRPRDIRRMRRAAGLSQESLAARCDLHRNYVGSVERAERNIGVDNMQAIATALQTTVAALVTEEE